MVSPGVGTEEWLGGSHPRPRWSRPHPLPSPGTYRDHTWKGSPQATNAAPIWIQSKIILKLFLLSCSIYVRLSLKAMFSIMCLRLMGSIMGLPENGPWPFHSHSSGHRNRVKQADTGSPLPRVRSLTLGHFLPIGMEGSWKFEGKGTSGQLSKHRNQVTCFRFWGRRTKSWSMHWMGQRGEGEGGERAAERFHPCFQKTENGKLESFPTWP